MYAYWLCTRERTGNIIDDVIAIFSDKRNKYPLTLHFYIGKLGFTGMDIILKFLP